MTNAWYVKNTLASCDGNLYLPILHLPRVELLCKLQEKLHRALASSGFTTAALPSELSNFSLFPVNVVFHNSENGSEMSSFKDAKPPLL